VKVEYEFNPFKITGVDDSELTKAQKKDILDDIADLVLTSVLDKVGSGESPVKGHGKFKLLNKEYADKEHGGKRVSHLELNGDMLDSLKVIVKGDRLLLTVDEDQQPKADGHNNFSGDSLIPTRRFIPFAKDGETFKKDIMEEMEAHIKDKIDEFKS
jgi:phage gpG-like protein